MLHDFFILCLLLSIGKVALCGSGDILDNTSPLSKSRGSPDHQFEDLARGLPSFPTAPRSRRIELQDEATEISVKDKKRKAMMEELFSESSNDSRSDHPSSSRGKVMQKGSRRYKVFQRKLSFQSEWQRKQLGTHLSPEELATEVTKMRMHGIKPASSSRFAMGIVQEKADSEYEAKYKNHLTTLEARILHHRKDLKRYSSDSLDPLQMEKVALKKALNPSYARKKLKDIHAPRLSPSKLLKAEKAAQKGAALLDTFQEHLDRKELHLSNAPLEVLEEELRMMPMSWMQQRDLFVYLKKYLKNQRRVPIAELNKLTKDRSAILGRKNDDNYKARKKQKRIELQEHGTESDAL